jgi:hypothetical protein
MLMNTRLRPYWKPRLLPAIYVVFGAVAGIHTISLSEVQRLHLIGLVARDCEARAVFARRRAEADRALQVEPHPICMLHSAGRLRSDPLKREIQASLKDMAKRLSLGMAFAVTGNSRYSSKAEVFILNWAAYQ